MSLGRRKVRLEDASDWVFNRMVDVYAARPPYPAALLDSLVARLGPAGSRVVDVGAGIGHLALPLAARGFELVAVEPALAMLEELRKGAAAARLELATVHATAEALPLERASQDAVLVADALHFLDATLASNELARVLRPHGAVAVVVSEPADTPYMRTLTQIIDDSVPRRARQVLPAVRQLAKVVGVQLEARTFHDEVAVTPARLEQILRSISFIGPAMNGERFAAFSRRVHALPAQPVWARRFTLFTGQRAG